MTAEELVEALARYNKDRTYSTVMEIIRESRLKKQKPDGALIVWTKNQYLGSK